MSTVSYVSEKTYWEWSTRGFPEAADVLITTEAPVGEVAPFPGDQTYLITRRVFAMRGKKGLLDNAYLLYTCLSSIVQDELQSRIRGSTVPRVLKTDILGLQIPLPSIEEQKAIAHILGTLDDKIELNRKTNETLEAIAKALFKSWFVDFDPVRAKAKGLPTGLPAEISDLFPDSFEDSELGEIPSGWEVKALDEIAHFLNGLALQKFPPEDGAATLPVIKIAQLKKGDSTGADRCSTAVPSDYVVRDGDMLFSWSGSLAVDIWCGGDGALNQHLFKVTSKTYAKWFFCLWVKHHLPVFQEIAQGKATTMGHIQRHHLSEAKVLIPPPSLLAAMDSAFTALLDRAFGLRRQSKDLGSIRDALLPKLISGEIRIPDAEKMLEEVGV
ncbi:restriction endonuclease subunit S [Cyanobium usitatum str. Tous]|uniref:Restriction endonuclease subunit S n=2 Tax=Prochlorococcaceae TaxID=2881426 RepID=A0A2P7MX38_9CYAN|nr:restriction endonuclease subunit S [Cyanobium usitatum str. Tous]